MVSEAAFILGDLFGRVFSDESANKKAEAVRRTNTADGAMFARRT